MAMTGRGARWLAALLAWLALASTAMASAPESVVRVVVPFAAGGPTDTLGRLVAAAMARDLRRTVLVENVTGAGGTLGAARVARAAPDGTTLLLINLTQATSRRMYKQLSYDPIASFAPIGLVADVPMTLVGRGDFPAADLPGLVAELRAHPRDVSMGYAGLGTSSHLCGVLLTSSTATNVLFVPYTGSAPALKDILGGQIDLLCDQPSNTAGYIRTGRVRAFATSAPARLAILPDLPTAAEGGVPAVALVVWHGLYAPAGTPEAIVRRLSRALQAAVSDAEVTERVAAFGGTTVPVADATPAALATRLAAESERLGALLEAAGVTAD
jgi:tripartite-type tricarboxylate transporter receptor subunit TctC